MWRIVFQDGSNRNFSDKAARDAHTTDLLVFYDGRIKAVEDGCVTRLVHADPWELDERTIGGQHAFLSEELLDTPCSTSVLDVGCGTGAWLARLRALGFNDLTGVDMDPPPSHGGINFIRSDFDRHELVLDRKFDLVTCIEVIEHVENPGLLLSQMASVLAPSGRLLVTTPNIESLRARIKFMLTGWLPSFDYKSEPTHITPILLYAFTKTAAKHGLSIERVWTYRRKSPQIFRWPIRTLAGIASMAVADPLPGDSLCVWLRFNSAPAEA